MALQEHNKTEALRMLNKDPVTINEENLANIDSATIKKNKTLHKIVPHDSRHRGAFIKDVLWRPIRESGHDNTST